MRKQTKIAAMVSAAALLAIGASMASFAAAGWAQEDGEWVYLNRDGDRVEREWKVSNGNYYWLGDEGVMVTNEVIEDDDNNIYYVDENGVRVTNRWISVDNVEDESPDGKEVDTLWYYFGSSGKAYRADAGTDKKVRTVPYSAGDGKFVFDEDGHMISGWTYVAKTSGSGSDIYYLGDENEGWAHTGWQYLEPAEDSELLYAAPADGYEDQEWFYFPSSGKAHANTTKYISGSYYTFDRNGVLEDEWLTDKVSTSSTPGKANQFRNVNGAKNGWVYASKPDDEDSSAWFYLVTVDGGVRTVAFGSGYNASNTPTDLKAARDNIRTAKSIGGKIYIFNGVGEMLDGLVEVKTTTADTWKGVAAKQLVPGYYYFSKADASQGSDGRMLKGKVTHTDNGDTFYYYFDKTDGYSLVNEVKDNTLYGSKDGARIQADDGNSNMLVDVAKLAAEGAKYGNHNFVKVGNQGNYVAGTLVVSSSGKVKKSGTVTIDDKKYKVENYFVVKSWDKGENEPTADNYYPKATLK